MTFFPPRKSPAAIAAILLAVAAGPGRADPVDGVGTPQAQTPAPLAATVSGRGVLQALRRSSVSVVSAARVRELSVEVGEVVEAGEKIARLDDGRRQSALQSAERRLRAQKELFETMRVALLQSQTRLAAAAQRAKSEGEGVGAASTAQRIASTRVAALAERVSTLKAAARATELEIAEHRDALAAMTITAPYDAVVLSKGQDVGGVVTPGGALVELADVDSLALIVGVDQTALGRIEVGQTASVVFASDPSAAHRAAVHGVSPMVDPASGQVGVALLLDTLPPNWALGQSGVATLHVGDPVPLATRVAFAPRRRGPLPSPVDDLP